MKEDQITILKSRIAKAMVESLFREGGYRVCRAERDGAVQRVVVQTVTKSGTLTTRPRFVPDFVVFRQENPSLYRLFHLEVSYCSNLDAYLKEQAEKGAESVFEERANWPELHFILVTDQLKRGRSCFQVASLEHYRAGIEAQTMDLADCKPLELPREMVTSYHAAVQDVFSALHYQVQLSRQLHVETPLNRNVLSTVIA